jgi:hypothetical protein
MGEKGVAQCGRYTDIFSSNPIPGCDDGYADVSDAMIVAAEKSGNSYNASEARRMRAEMAAVCNKPGNQRNKDGKSTLTAQQICAKAALEGDDSELRKKIAVFAYHNTIGGKTGWELVCAALGGSAKHVSLCQTPGTAGVGGNAGTTAVDNCPKTEASVVAAYIPVGGSDLLADSSTSDSSASSASSGDAASFCNGSNNSGPYNTKDSMNPGSNPNNPMETSRTATH